MGYSSLSGIEDMYFGAPAIVRQYAKELRKRETLAEKTLWLHLRNRKLSGFKFRRQHPISLYIVDFFCVEKKLSIEVDGSVHDSEEAYNNDSVRTEALDELGVHEIRFSNYEVQTKITEVLNKIELALDSIP
jgi:very-short-patch-repair endonuclease